MSLFNENFILWIILAFSVTIFIIMIFLINQNSKMLRRLDVIDCRIFNQNVNLEYNEDDDSYTFDSPIIIVLNSLLIPETTHNNPTVMVEIEYPSELQLDYKLFEFTSVESKSSNRARFKVALKSEVIVITISSLSLSTAKERDFDKSDKKIKISFESNLLPETKVESLLVSY